MKKKFMLTGLIIFLVAVLCVGVTWAILLSMSRTLENTFTYGEIEIELTEGTGRDYMITPGVTYKKDPRIAVLSDSESCYLFCRVSATEDFDSYMEWSVADGWTKLDGYSGIWWRVVESKPYDNVFSILAEDKVTVKDTVTKQQLAAIDHYPKLTFYAYAIQTHSVSDAVSAWQLITEEQEGQ